MFHFPVKKCCTVQAFCKLFLKDLLKQKDVFENGAYSNGSEEVHVGTLAIIIILFQKAICLKSSF